MSIVEWFSNCYILFSLNNTNKYEHLQCPTLVQAFYSPIEGLFYYHHHIKVEKGKHGNRSTNLLKITRTPGSHWVFWLWSHNLNHYLEFGVCLHSLKRRRLDWKCSCVGQLRMPSEKLQITFQVALGTLGRLETMFCWSKQELLKMFRVRNEQKLHWLPT